MRRRRGALPETLREESGHCYGLGVAPPQRRKGGTATPDSLAGRLCGVAAEREITLLTRSRRGCIGIATESGGNGS